MCTQDFCTSRAAKLSSGHCHLTVSRDSILMLQIMGVSRGAGSNQSVLICLSQQLLDPSPSYKSHQLSIDYTDRPHKGDPIIQPQIFSSSRSRLRAICHSSSLSSCGIFTCTMMHGGILGFFFRIVGMQLMRYFTAPMRESAGSAIRTINPLKIKREEKKGEERTPFIH